MRKERQTALINYDVDGTKRQRYDIDNKTVIDIDEIPKKFSSLMSEAGSPCGVVITTDDRILHIGLNLN